jgi:tRNA(Ile)-lysidine synthase TilS/MesJ
MPDTEKPPTRRAHQRQIRVVIPALVWDDLAAYAERNAHESICTAAREIIRQALVRERSATGHPA